MSESGNEIKYFESFLLWMRYAVKTEWRGGRMRNRIVDDTGFRVAQSLRSAGVQRSGMVNTNPASPSLSGIAPRSIASTGIPLAIASIGTRLKDFTMGNEPRTLMRVNHGT
jgi:hypothetical protein